MRSAFIASESLTERVRQFRIDRIAKITADETPVPLEANPKIVLHIAPISSFTLGTNIDLTLLENGTLNLQPIHNRSRNSRYNFDGFLTYSGYSLIEKPVCYAYAQIFRNGAIETVEADLLSPSGENKLIPSVEYEDELIKALQGYLELHKDLELNPPSIIMLSLLDVKGYKMSFNFKRSGEKVRFLKGQPIDRDILLLPEIVVGDYDSKASDILRPAFDAIWQACGCNRSENYDDRGNWVRDRR